MTPSTTEILLQSLIQSNPLPIFIVDHHHLIRSTSTQADHLFGFKIGHPLTSISHQDHHAQIIDAYQRAQIRFHHSKNHLSRLPISQTLQPTTVEVSLIPIQSSSHLNHLHHSNSNSTSTSTSNSHSNPLQCHQHHHPHNHSSSLLQIIQIDAFEPRPGLPELWYSCQLRARDPPATSERDQFITRMSHAIFDSPVSWPMHAVSIDRTVSIANPAACSLFQALNPLEDHTETVGGFQLKQWSLFDSSFQTEVPLIDFPVERAMRGETISNEEYGCIMPDQSRRIIKIGAKTIRTDPLKQYPNHSREDILGGLIYVHDVTDEINRRREAEREKERLRQEAIASEDANQSKSTFLSNMSHEIRTPIANVLGIIELLLETELDSLQRDYAETIKSSADGLLDVVGDILDFSKIECGKLSFDPSPFNLKDLFHELDRIFTHTARSKRSRFQSNLTIDPTIGTNPEIIGDKGRVRQVLSNLVSNSLKFAPTGRITLDLRLERSPPDRLKLSATIKDDGIGLTPESLRILTSWQPFSQAESSTSRLYGGSGLGLCIVKTLVDAMDGTVSLESEGLGKGCKAKVEMMLQYTTNTNHTTPNHVHSPDSCNPPNPKSIPESNHRRSSQSTKRRTRSVRNKDASNQSRLTKSRDQYWILLAEDNPIMAKITIGLLKKIGLSKVDLVENGKEAVERIKNRIKIYDLVILDLIMPVLDGFEATKEIRELELKGSDRVSLPIIALSASATRGDRERCTEVQMDDYLTKPIKSDVLEERVLHFLALGEKRRGIHHSSSSDQPIKTHPISSSKQNKK